MTKKYG